MASAIILAHMMQPSREAVTYTVMALMPEEDRSPLNVDLLTKIAKEVTDCLNTARIAAGWPMEGEEADTFMLLFRAHDTVFSARSTRK
jgi:hypothetical protein